MEPSIQRSLKVLLSLLDKLGAEGTIVIDPKTHAELIGLSPKTLRRHLSNLAKAGVIRVKKERVADKEKHVVYYKNLYIVDTTKVKEIARTLEKSEKDTSEGSNSEILSYINELYEKLNEKIEEIVTLLQEILQERGGKESKQETIAPAENESAPNIDECREYKRRAVIAEAQVRQLQKEVRELEGKLRSLEHENLLLKTRLGLTSQKYQQYASQEIDEGYEVAP
jgi:DNA-binding Lrp family transcriptional regulator